MFPNTDSHQHSVLKIAKKRYGFYVMDTEILVEVEISKEIKILAYGWGTDECDNNKFEHLSYCCVEIDKFIRNETKMNVLNFRADIYVMQIRTVCLTMNFIWCLKFIPQRVRLTQVNIRNFSENTIWNNVVTKIFLRSACKTFQSPVLDTLIQLPVFSHRLSQTEYNITGTVQVQPWRTQEYTCMMLPQFINTISCISLFNDVRI